MSSGARLTGNIVTAALLAISILAIVDGLRVGEDVCQEVTSAFHSGQCPSATDVEADANVLTVEVDTTLGGDHFGRIVIAGDGVTLDCASHQVRGDGPAGIAIVGRRHVTIRNCAVTGFENALQLTNTTDSHLIDNTITASQHGISLERSDRNEIRSTTTELLQTSITLNESDGNDIVGNTIVSGDFAIRLFSESSDNRIRDNKLVGASVTLWTGGDNTVEANQIEGDWRAGGINAKGTRVAVLNNEIDNVGTAITVEGHDAVVSGNRVANTNLGIAIDGTSASVSDNTLDVNTIGIQVRGEAHVVANNVIDGGSRAALRLWKAKSVRLTDNQVVDGDLGIEMTLSRDNIVRNNDVAAATKGIDGVAVTIQNTFELNRGLELIEPLVIAQDTTLRADHEGPIVLGADNVTLDCAGHRVMAPPQLGDDRVTVQAGITIEARQGVALRNCEVAGYGKAIMLWEARDSELENNRGSLALHASNRNEISGHAATSIGLFRSHRNAIRDSVVSNEITLQRSDKNHITDNTINGRGIAVRTSDDNVISDNEIPDGRIHVQVAAGNTVRANSLTREVGACFLIGQVATDNVVEDNVASGCSVGFVVNNAEGNTISGNTATDCKTGFRLIDVRDSQFIGNTTDSPVDFRSNPGVNESNTFTDNVGFEAGT